MKYLFILFLSICLFSCGSKSDNYSDLYEMNNIGRNLFNEGGSIINGLISSNPDWAYDSDYEATATKIGDNNSEFTVVYQGAIPTEQINIPTTAEPLVPPTKVKSSKKDKTKIVKSGAMSFEVEDIHQSKTQIDQLLDQFDGYYEDEKFQNYGNRKGYNLEIRLPSALFDTLILSLENGDSDIIAKNIIVENVTEEYTDLQIRLKNKLMYLTQYQEVLKKAKSIQDILDVKEKIRYIEEEIESKKGRILFLDDKVKLSSLKVKIIQDIEPKIKRNKFIKRISSALSGGYDGFLSFVVWLIYQWPLIILLGFVWMFRKKLFKLFRK